MELLSNEEIPFMKNALVVLGMSLLFFSQKTIAQQKVKKYFSVEVLYSSKSKGKTINPVNYIDYGSPSNFTHIADSALIIASLDSVTTFKNKIDIISYLESKGWHLDQYFLVTNPYNGKEMLFSKDFFIDDKNATFH